MNKTTIPVKHLFGGVYMYLGLLFAMIGVIFFLFEIWVSLVLIFVSILAFTTVQKLSIVKEHGYYHTYTWLLGIKIGRKIPFQSIDYLLINKNTYVQRIRVRGGGSVTEYDMYKGYIVFDHDIKVFIGESKKKSKIEKRMQLLKENYQLELIDKA